MGIIAFETGKEIACSTGKEIAWTVPSAIVPKNSCD